MRTRPRGGAGVREGAQSEWDWPNLAIMIFHAGRRPAAAGGWPAVAHLGIGCIWGTC